MNEEKKLEITNRVTNILLDIGVPANLRGFHYLRYGVLLAYDNFKNATNGATKFLYPGIAGEFDTTATRVERAMRHSIEVAFDEMRGENAAKYFGRAASAKSGKVTNMQFVMILADRLLREDGIRPTI